MHSDSSMVVQPHWSCEVLLVEWIDWLDLPKLTSLATNGENSGTFRNPRHITLESDSRPLWMMFRHTQSRWRGSSKCIRLHEWHHHQRRCSLHPSLTNRHRSSCISPYSAIEARDSSLCATHYSSSFESPSHQCNQQHNDHSYFKRNQCMQNRWNNPSCSFSKTTWNTCIFHSTISSFHSMKAGIDVGYPSSIHVDIEQCFCLDHISKGIQERLR